MERQPLWTRNFTILTLGTVVSMLGNAISGFALSLLVLDYTGSTLLYAVYMIVCNVPKVIVPSIAGPYLDRFSRTKVIWGLDYISAGLYLLLFFMLSTGVFNYVLLLALCFMIGTIDGIYRVPVNGNEETLFLESGDWVELTVYATLRDGFFEAELSR